MDLARRWKRGWVVALGLGTLAPGGAYGQFRERDVTITGPRGRSIERHMESRLGPNGLTRDLTITRPGGTYQRETHFGGRPAFVPGPRGNVFVERDVFINGGRGGGMNPWASFGLGAALGTGAGVLLDRAFAPPPPVYVAPPVVMAPAPVYVQPAPPPTVIYNPPVRYQAAPPQTVVVDPVAQQIARFASHHAPSRRDAAAVLGRLGDARAVPPLVERLKFDTDKSVRITAANAIAQIGDPQGAIYLERASIYDKKQDVRDAAAAALARMPRAASADASASVPGAVAASPGFETYSSESTAPPLERAERIPPPPPTPAGARR